LDDLTSYDEDKARNEVLADYMRKFGICEKKGSGVDKTLAVIELFQLPPLHFMTQERHTKVALYKYKALNEMDKTDKIRACYQHCCLRYVLNESMNNQTLRERLAIDDRNYPIASNIIRDTLQAGRIKDRDPDSTSKKFATYIPYWASAGEKFM
jgi:ATP-dependent DNA helicase RecG